MSEPGARIVSVREASPADDAGFTEGYELLEVNGHVLRDMIDWAWFSADDFMQLRYRDPSGSVSQVLLERYPGEDWGFGFDDFVFDKIKTCRNSCTFCFMRQLPPGARPSLSLRDDDYRMSFFTGTFVTLTNVSREEEARIIEQKISPLRMSLHAITPKIRKRLIGRHEAKGIEVAERLLNAGIEMHLQIVLVPGENDGEELERSLEWAFAHESVKGVAVVPLGYTKHQHLFTKSFNDTESASSVLRIIERWQKKAANIKDQAWVYAADEFYRNAYPESILEKLPPAGHYGEYELFEDGIGIIRSTIDAWNESATAICALAQSLEAKNKTVHFVAGYAQKEFIVPLIEASPLQGRLIPIFVKNEFFGGNVDVTGLLTGQDIADALNTAALSGESISLAVLPRVIFNSDKITLDDMSFEDIQSRSKPRLAVVSCSPSDYIQEIHDLVEKTYEN